MQFVENYEIYTRTFKHIENNKTNEIIRYYVCFLIILKKINTIIIYFITHYTIITIRIINIYI